LQKYSFLTKKYILRTDSQVPGQIVIIITETFGLNEKVFNPHQVAGSGIVLRNEIAGM